MKDLKKQSIFAWEERKACIEEGMRLLHWVCKKTMQDETQAFFIKFQTMQQEHLLPKELTEDQKDKLVDFDPHKRFNNPKRKKESTKPEGWLF